MSSIISQTVKEATDAKNIAISSKSEVTAAYQEAIANATAAITGNSGGYIRLNPSENPQELLIMDTADASTATKIWRWNLSGLGYSSTGYSGPYKTAITQDGHIVADFIDTGTLTANIIKAGIMQSVNGQFSFNLETGHIEASDINITGGDINLDGGQLSVLNNDGYKADLSGGVLDLYQGAGTGSGTGYKYLTFGSSMLLTTAISGNWYATIAAPEFTLGEQSSKGFRFGTSTANASAAMPAVGGLTNNWNTDYMLVEKDTTRIRRTLHVNEYGYTTSPGEYLAYRATGYNGDNKFVTNFGASIVAGSPAFTVRVQDTTSAGNNYVRADLFAAQSDRAEVRLMDAGGNAYRLTFTQSGITFWSNTTGPKKLAFV